MSEFWFSIFVTLFCCLSKKGSENFPEITGINSYGKICLYHYGNVFPGILIYEKEENAYTIVRTFIDLFGD